MKDDVRYGAKISAALAKLSPADRKKLEGMLPKF